MTIILALKRQLSDRYFSAHSLFSLSKEGGYLAAMLQSV